MTDAFFANNNHEQPLCYLKLEDADCLFVRQEINEMVLVYYWYADEKNKWLLDNYCLMQFYWN